MKITLIRKSREMDIKTASEMFGHDRILIIGLVQLLIDKKIIENQKDMDEFKKTCIDIMVSIKNMTKDPVALIQIEKTEIELEHFFGSFRIR